MRIGIVNGTRVGLGGSPISCGGTKSDPEADDDDSDDPEYDNTLYGLPSRDSCPAVPSASIDIDGEMDVNDDTRSHANTQPLSKAKKVVTDEYVS